VISIVMPTKNAEKHIAECLTSIINQSFTDWELLVVNDHSTDSTRSILQEFSDKHARITFFNNKGSGIIKALQLAYKNSKGDYITRMDSDDIMPSNKLELMSKALESNPDSLITGYVRYISDNELKGGYIYYQNWLNSLVDENKHFAEIYKECVIPSPCWMVSRETFEKCGAFHSNTYPEDYDLTFRFYENKTPIISLKEELHVWRDHQARASRNDANYSDNSFLDIKLHYFLKLDLDKTKTLVLWGAGKKAKNIAKLLIDKHITFEWACNNPNKIGHSIYDIKMLDIQNIFSENIQYQSIITVANKEEQKEIDQFSESKNNLDLYWFC
jgi:glycosyltransferase involved in cell wall biosynthesis